jgi:hypothetical protein
MAVKPATPPTAAINANLSMGSEKNVFNIFEESCLLLQTLVIYYTSIASNGSLTLAKFISETASESDTRQSLLYLPWPPWATRQKNRNDPICGAPPKVAKASKEGDVTCH